MRSIKHPGRIAAAHLKEQSANATCTGFFDETSQQGVAQSFVAMIGSNREKQQFLLVQNTARQEKTCCFVVFFWTRIAIGCNQAQMSS